MLFGPQWPKQGLDSVERGDTLGLSVYFNGYGWIIYRF